MHSSQSTGDQGETPGPGLIDRVDAIDVRAYWHVIARRRWLALPFFAAVVLVTILATLRQQKIYDATCTLIIDQSAPKILDNDQVKDVTETGAAGYLSGREYLETQNRILTSRAVAERVANRLQLGANLRFMGLEGVSDEAERTRRLKAASPIDRLLANVHVELVKDSRVVLLRYEDPDPQLAALIANAWADAYIEQSLAVKNATTQNATEWLEQQLADLEVKLDKSGKELFEFKRSHDIVATSWEDRQSMVSQRLTTINEALTRARVRKAELQARNDQIQALGDVALQDEDRAESLPPVAGSQVIQTLRAKYLETKAECAELETRYLPDHPRLESCRARLTAAKTAINKQIQDVLVASREEYNEIATVEANLQKLLNDTKADAFGLNRYERDYLELKRTYDNNQRLYELVLKRLKDTGVTGLLQVSNVRVLDRARPSMRPVRPRVALNIGLAVVFGLLGGIALAFAVEFLDNSITTREQIEERLGITFLGVIPSASKDPAVSADLVVHQLPKSAMAECVRSVRTNLLFMSPEKPLRTILVTSSGPQEGKTTTSASLAQAMADSGNRVLLVDADMRRPRVHGIFGVPDSEGLSSLVLGEGTLAAVAKSTNVPNLFVLPCGPVPPNPAELLHTARFKALLADAAEAFDRVIIDSPPIGVVADAAVISTLVDGTVVVLKAESTTRDSARRAVRQLQDVKARVFGAVLNQLDLDRQGYGQYYEYRTYGYYEADAGAGSSSRPA